MKDPGGVHDAPPEMLKRFPAPAHCAIRWRCCAAAATGQLSVRLMPEESKDGRALKVLGVSGERCHRSACSSTRSAASSCKIGYDARGQGPLYTEEVFDDYPVASTA